MTSSSNQHSPSQQLWPLRCSQNSLSFKRGSGVTLRSFQDIRKTKKKRGRRSAKRPCLSSGRGCELAGESSTTTDHDEVSKSALAIVFVLHLPYIYLTFVIFGSLLKDWHEFRRHRWRRSSFQRPSAPKLGAGRCDSGPYQRLASQISLSQRTYRAFLRLDDRPSQDICTHFARLQQQDQQTRANHCLRIRRKGAPAT